MTARRRSAPLVSVLLLVLAAAGPGPAARARGDEPRPLNVVMLSGSEEYRSDLTLAQFKSYLESRRPGVRCAILQARGTTDLPGLEALDAADVLLVFTRRLSLPPEQLDRIKGYVASGRPVVGVRTASHAFQTWLAFDPDVLGGRYTNHYRNGPSQRTRVAAGAADHPILSGVGTIASRGSLYACGPVAPDVRVLLESTAPDATEPAAWVRESDGRRVFYTSLGAIGDFENASFLRLLENALFWAAGRDVPPVPAASRPPLRPAPEGTIRLALRHRETDEHAPGGWREVMTTEDVPAAKVGVVVCDMWDLHWCRGATERADAIAARMEPVLAALRARGVQVVHAPSETMDFYRGTPARLRAQMAPPATLPEHPLPDIPPLPIDDSDGGCDTDDDFYLAWTRQNPRISVADPDAVSDSGEEIRNLFAEQGITHVLMMGVHTNMCVLNRAFAIKEMTRRGFRCVLVRDLTDAMYDPRDPPKVAHDEGTALVIGHIEGYLCPSTSSAQLVEGLGDAAR